MLTKPEILVIDNDQNILWAFNNFLARLKIKMTGTTTIKNGLDVLSKKNFDLIIFDARPDFNSISKFIEKTKQIVQNIPIIATTSYPDKINAALLKPYGIKYLFTKPLDLVKLQTAIISCLQLSLPEKFSNQYLK